MSHQNPRKIVIVKPCCIGDVIFATPLLTALRRGYPDAVIDWVVGTSASSALSGHPDLGQMLDSGPSANPAARPASFLRLVQTLQHGKYDLAVVPDRSPLLGMAVALSGIPQRAGLDSAGRGFGYTIKAPIDPATVRHEADIYLDIARVLGLSTEGCWANVPHSEQAIASARELLIKCGATGKPLIVIHPGGGVNAGMTMVQKRWPADRFAALADRAADALNGEIVIIGVQSDASAINAVTEALRHPAINMANQLSLPVTGALASLAALYVGNDTGVGHLAAASGGKVLMIFGPSDPRRYAPFVSPAQAQVAWRPVTLPEHGVSGGVSANFAWDHDGVTVDEVWERATLLLREYIQ